MTIYPIYRVGWVNLQGVPAWSGEFLNRDSAAVARDEVLKTKTAYRAWIERATWEKDKSSIRIHDHDWSEWSYAVSPTGRRTCKSCGEIDID